jgi:hypothetical protein
MLAQSDGWKLPLLCPSLIYALSEEQVCVWIVEKLTDEVLIETADRNSLKLLIQGEGKSSFEQYKCQNNMKKCLAAKEHLPSTQLQCA